MALTDSNDSRPLAVPAPGALPVRIPPPLHALTRLPELHAEISETSDLARFLRSAVPAGAALTLMAGTALAFAGGSGLKQEFAWSFLMLLGVAAMLRSYIRSTAQAFDRAPLREAARDLRAVLFYVGFAWGAGAFLLLGNDPVPLVGLCFAVLPSALLAPLLKDRAAGLSFLAPVTGLSGAAILLEPWSDAPAALAILLIVQSGIAAGLMLPGRTRLPAGLVLR